VSIDWNEEARALVKVLKAEKGVKWDEVVQKINLANPDEKPLTVSNVQSSIAKGNYNIRLLLKIADALEVEIAFKEKG
jgi:LEA14-like dessication related protein